MSALLEVKKLSVSFDRPTGELWAVRDVSFELKKGEVLGIVGESGCGKSVLLKSIIGLLPRVAHISSGQILIDGENIADMTEKQMTAIRGRRMAMVFQDPMATLNPTMSVGKQVYEAVKLRHPEYTREQCRNRVCELMEMVGIADARVRYKMPPYSFSGGMRQRIVIAIALAGEPEILLLDEPTTALDVTIQASIMKLFKSLSSRLHIGVVLISHDISLVAGIANRICVMYAGKIVERGLTQEVTEDARHPYTKALMKAMPIYGKRGEKLYTIPGMPISIIGDYKKDAFAERNVEALDIDHEQMPPEFRVTDTHYAATWLLDGKEHKVVGTLKDYGGEGFV